MRRFLWIQALVFSCCLGGMLCGWLGVATFGRSAFERYQADHPGEYVCGLFALPYLFLGYVAGAVAGGLLFAWGSRAWVRSRGR
jgi:hypothetical protein